MHNCDQIKELLLTDYLDDRLDVKALAEVEAHLKRCTACRQMAQELKEDLKYPLQQAARQDLPEQIWQNIKEKIEVKTDAKHGFLDRISAWGARFSFPRMIPLLGSLAVAVVLVSSVLVSQFSSTTSVSRVEDMQEAQLLLLTSVSTGLMSEEQTPIERYFL